MAPVPVRVLQQVLLVVEVNTRSLIYAAPMSANESDIEVHRRQMVRLGVPCACVHCARCEPASEPPTAEEFAELLRSLGVQD